MRTRYWWVPLLLVSTTVACVLTGQFMLIPVYLGADVVGVLIVTALGRWLYG